MEVIEFTKSRQSWVICAFLCDKSFSVRKSMVVLHNVFNSCVLVARKIISASWTGHTGNRTTSSWIFIGALSHYLLFYSFTTLIFVPRFSYSFLMKEGSLALWIFDIFRTHKFTRNLNFIICIHFLTIHSLIDTITWLNPSSCSFFLNNVGNNFITHSNSI